MLRVARTVNSTDAHNGWRTSYDCILLCTMTEFDGKTGKQTERTTVTTSHLTGAARTLPYYAPQSSRGSWFTYAVLHVEPVLAAVALYHAACERLVAQAVQLSTLHARHRIAALDCLAGKRLNDALVYQLHVRLPHGDLVVQSTCRVFPENARYTGSYGVKTADSGADRLLFEMPDNEFHFVRVVLFPQQ